MSGFDKLMAEFLEPQDDVTEDIHLSILAENVPMTSRIAWIVSDKLHIFYADPKDENENSDLAGFDSSNRTSNPSINKVKEDFQKHRRFIKYYSLPNMFRAKPAPDPIPLSNCIFHFFLFSIMIKWFCLLILQVIMLRSMQSWNPEVRSGSNRTETCALREDINDKYDSTAELYIQLRDFSASIGHEAIYSAPLFLFTAFVTTSGIAVLYSAVAFYRNDTIYLNTLSFLRRPVNERKRIRMKLNEIVLNLHETAFHLCRDSSCVSELHQIESWLHPNPKPLNDKRASRLSIDQSNRRQSKVDLNNCRCAEEGQKRLQFANFISGEKLVNYVRPAHLTVDFFKQILRRNVITGFMHFIIFMLGFTWVPLKGEGDESRLRIRDRFEILRCGEWNKNATLIRDPIGLGRQPWSPKLRNLYREYNLESTEDNFKLLIQAELEIMQESPNPFAIVEFVFYYLAAMGWTYHYVLAFVQSTMSINKWLGQIRTQMDNCIKLIDHHLDYCADFNSNLGIRFGLDDEAKVRLRNIEKALTITYLNFELFRQEYKAFERVSSFVISQLIPMAILNSISSYLAALLSTKDVGTIWTFNATFIILLNYFISDCVFTLNKVQKAYYIITRILTKLSSISLDQSQIAVLLRRQMLNDRDLAQCYSIKVFKANFSSSTMIAIDSYVVALWLVMIRQIG